MNYSSAITFLYYKDFSYGVDFIEQIFGLELVMDQGFARVYRVNQKSFLGIVQETESSDVPGSTLVSLATNTIEEEYKRIRTLEVYKLTTIKHFTKIPLKSFFFDDLEGHKFEIQQFLKQEDQEQF